MKGLAIAFLAGMATVSLSATTADFNFTDQSGSGSSCGALNGNCVFSGYSQSSSVGGTQGGTATNSVTVSAWEVATSGTGSTGNLTGAYLGVYSGYGLGACDSVLGSGCSSPYHQVNNDNQSANDQVQHTAPDYYEFVEFQFSTPVDISQIQLANFGVPTGQVDMSDTVWASSSTINLGSTTLSELGTGTNFNCTNAASSGSNCSTSETWSDPYNSAYGQDSPTVVENTNLNDVTTLIIAAQIGQSDDFFKVQDFSGLNFTPTPEPATFGLLGLALVGFGILGRKRKSK